MIFAFGKLRSAARFLPAVIMTMLVMASYAAHGATRPRFVQKKVLQVTSGSSIPLTFTRPNKPAGLIVAYIVWDNGDPVSLTDSAGNAYTSAAGPTQAGDGFSSEIFYAGNIAGGANTVTATFTMPVAARAVLSLFEYSGVDAASPVEAAVAASGTASSMVSGVLTVGNLNDLLFVGARSSGSLVSRVSPGYRIRLQRFGSLAADILASKLGSASVTATQKGTAWTMQMVAFRPADLAPTNFHFPVKVGASGRYLVDQNNKPFLITGDSPQSLIVNLSETQAGAFFADRQAAGFNALWINLLCSTYTAGRADASTYDGIVPFTTPGDLSKPNERYFARVDHMLQLAAQHGLTVLLDPAETGSFLSVLRANGLTKARSYGRYLGARYRNANNIIWISGNDFQSWQNPDDDALVQAVALGIQDADTRHIHTVELNYYRSGSLDDPGWAPIIQLNASYTYYPTYDQVLTDYNRANPLPTFLVEAHYEFEEIMSETGTTGVLRRQAYWALLSGAAGQMYGNHYTWTFTSGWQTRLDSPGAAQMGYVRSLFEPRRWYDLVPDQTHATVTAGYGTYSASSTLADNDYLTAARTPDGALVMAYMPTIRTITVDMTKLAGLAGASWYDPSNGTYAAAPGSPFANTGTQDFTPPGNNSEGSGDWVLVLETQ